MPTPRTAPLPPTLRDDLLALSDRLPAFALTLVVAPAGSGKTTLLDAWRQRLEARGERSAYLDLTPLHGAPGIFGADLLAAWARALPGFGAETRRALASLPEGEAGWLLLLRALRLDWGERGEPLVCVLDNFHELPPQSDAERLVSELLRAPLPNLTWVVASRGQVPAAAPRLRTADAVLEIGMEDLNLHADEIRRLLSERGVEADAELTARLLARTAGWATGVQLAARRLRELPESERSDYVARLGREEDLFGFIAAEVLADASPELVDVVERVAVLGRCRPDDVAALSARGDAAGEVARAVERGVLLSDGKEVWLHQLWQDVVTERMQARLGREGLRELRRAAGEQLRERGRLEEAIAAFAAAGDWRAVSVGVREAGESWLLEGRIDLLRHWLERLPDEEVASEAPLLLMRGLSLARRTPEQAAPFFDRAARMFHQQGNRDAELFCLGHLALLAATNHQFDGVIRALRRMISLRGLLRSPAERGMLLVLLAGQRLFAGRFGRSLRLSERASRAPLDWSLVWVNSMNLALLRLIRGEWDGALAAVDAALEDRRIARHPYTHHTLRLQRARVLAARGDFKTAAADAQRAAEAFRDYRISVLREIPPIVLGQALSNLGDRNGSRQAFEQAVQQTREGGNRGSEGLARASFAVEQFRWGEFEAASREARRAVEALRDPDARGTRLWPWWLLFSLWVLARAGHAEEAWRLAQEQRAWYRQPDAGLAHHTMRLALADLARLAGDEDEARRLARDAWQFAADEDIQSVDRNLGDVLAAATAPLVLRDGVCTDYVVQRLETVCPDRVVAILAELLEDRSATVRQRAVALLARRGGRGAWTALRGVEKDRSARVRDAAKTALAAIDPRPDHVLRVESLGRLAVWRGDVEVPPEAWRGQTARRLFARLLVAEGQPVSRDVLQEELWPDSDPEAARNNLRVATSRLNDALDPDRPAGAQPYFVIAEGDALRLHRDVVEHWDVTAFRAALARAGEAERERADREALDRTRDALALYAGPFLPELLEDDWAAVLRRQVAERFVAAAHRAGPRMVRRGRLDDTMRLVDQLLEEDTADERAWALRMRVQLARHDRSGALRSYDEASRTLRRELDVAPGTELEELAAQARSHAA